MEGERAEEGEEAEAPAEAESIGGVVLEAVRRRRRLRQRLWRREAWVGVVRG